MSNKVEEYRYRVVLTWGTVPSDIKKLVDAEDAYLVYPEYRGPSSQQSLFDEDAGIVGGWEMIYAGRRRND